MLTIGPNVDDRSRHGIRVPIQVWIGSFGYLAFWVLKLGQFKYYNFFGWFESGLPRYGWVRF